MPSIELALAELGGNTAHLLYCYGIESRPIDAWLTQCGWSLLGKSLFRFFVKGSVLEATWLDQACPEHFLIAPWFTISEDDRRLLEWAEEQENWIRFGFQPLRYEQRLDTALSQLLRYRGRVVGWINLRRSVPIRCVTGISLSATDFRSEPTSGVTRALAAAIRSQERRMGREATGIFEVADDNIAFRRFVSAAWLATSSTKRNFVA